MEANDENETFNLSDFDFIRIATPDLNGCHMSKLVPKKQFPRVESNEVDLYGGAIAFGPRNQFVAIEEFLDNNSRNAFFYPDFSTLRPIAWADDKANGFRVAEVIADMQWDDSSPLLCHPRLVAKRQIDRLKTMNFKLFSAFEPEFRAFKPGTFEPYTNGLDMLKTTLLAFYQSFFMDAVTKMLAAGVDIQDCSIEHGEGQLEMPLSPCFGIKAADKAFRFKQGIKEIGKSHGLTISFMTKPFPSESSNGNHYNHSLWYVDSGRNAMYDQTKPDNLSDVARHWLGGLIEHFSAITALCCPTVNCYTRLHTFLSPGPLTWDIDERLCSIRVKNFNEKLTYVENRLPSSSSCPYHVMAATIAAGIDGLQRKIEPPLKGNNDLGDLPKTFEEALNILDKDSIIKEALGEHFVNYFIRIKREVDLTEIPVDHCDSLKRLDLERNQYFDYI